MKKFTILMVAFQIMVVMGSLAVLAKSTTPKPTPTQTAVDGLADNKGHLVTNNRRTGGMTIPKKSKKKKPVKKAKVKVSIRTTVHQVKPGLWIDY